jgi:hypothetical protein
MPIKSGIGFGEAQVYNQPGAIVNLYGKLLQQQAKDQAQFATDLNNIMSKYSTKGLKDEDIKLTANAYQQIKDKVTSSSTRTPAERAQALADARNGMQTIQEYSDSALDAYKTLDQLAPDIALNPWKYQEGTKEVVEQLYKNPYAKWGNDYKTLNPTTFQRKADESAIYKMFNNVNSDLTKIAPTFKAKDVVDGRYYRTMYSVPEADAYNNLYTTMELTPEAKYTLTTKYQQENPDKTDFTPADVAAYGLGLYKKLYGENALQFAGGRTLIPKATGSGGQQQQAIYDRGALLDRITNAVPGSDDELLEVSSLPYGTTTQFLNVSKGGKLVKKLFKVTVPKSGWESAAASNPLLAEYGFGTDDASGKKKVFEFDLSSSDARRGINVFIDQFSGGKNVQYKDVKRKVNY